MSNGVMGRTPVALALAGALTACPNRPLDAARAALEAGRLDEAGEAFLAAAHRDPALLGAWDGAVEAWCVRAAHVGRCLSVLDLELDRLGSVDRHKDALSEALEGRARARMAAGLVQAALEDLDRAALAAPERAPVLVARARALAMLGQRDEALAALEAAQTIDPSHPELDEVRRMVPGPPAVPDLENAPPAGFGGPATTEPGESGPR